MSNSINVVTLLGNLGGDPRNITAGIAFNLATSERWTDDHGQRQERTDWHRCVIFGKRAEALQKILRKGSRVLVQGSLRTSSYTDRESGEKRYSVDVIAGDLVLLDPPPKGRTAPRDADDMPGEG